MAASVVVHSVTDEFTILRCSVDGMATTMHTVRNQWIADDPDNLKSEMARIRAEADKKAAAKKAALEAARKV